MLLLKQKSIRLILAVCASILCGQTMAADLVITGNVSVSGSYLTGPPFFGGLGWSSTEEIYVDGEFTNTSVITGLITKDDVPNMIIVVDPTFDGNDNITAKDGCFVTPERFTECTYSFDNGNSQPTGPNGLQYIQLAEEGATAKTVFGDLHGPASSYAITGTNFDFGTGGQVVMQADLGPDTIVPFIMNFSAPTSDITENGVRTIQGTTSFNFNFSNNSLNASSLNYTITMEVEEEPEETNVPMPLWSLILSGLTILYIATIRLRKSVK